MKRYVIAAVAAAGLLFGLAGTAGAATSVAKPDNISNSVDVTTNNGVGGFYADGGGSAYTYLGFYMGTTSTSDNLVPVNDGIGGQLCNPSTGETAGVGLERTGINTYGVFYGHGFLSGDSGAVDSSHGGEADGNLCLGGILPLADVHQLTTASAIMTGDDLHYQLKVYTVRILNRRVHHKTTRFRVAVDVTDSVGDTNSTVMAIGTQNPWFGQAGAGSQRSLAGLGSPADIANPLAEFWGVTDAQPYTGSWNDFGCGTATVEVNSAANSNNDNGLENNPYAQIDPSPSGYSGADLTGGCNAATLSNGGKFNVYEGNPNS